MWLKSLKYVTSCPANQIWVWLVFVCVFFFFLLSLILLLANVSTTWFWEHFLPRFIICLRKYQQNSMWIHIFHKTKAECTCEAWREFGKEVILVFSESVAALTLKSLLLDSMCFVDVELWLLFFLRERQMGLKSAIFPTNWKHTWISFISLWSYGNKCGITHCLFHSSNIIGELEHKKVAYTIQIELCIHINLQIDQIWASEHTSIVISDFSYWLVCLQN